MVTLVSVLHICICIFLVGVILLQQGKGADAGATLGGGANTLFGSAGANTLLVKITTFIAALFMLSSIFLAVNASRRQQDTGDLFKEAPKAAAPAPSSPAAPVPSATADAVPSPSVATEPQAAAPVETAPTAPSAQPTPAAQ